MVEEFYVGKPRFTVRDRDLQALANGRFAHGLVGAQRYQDIERLRHMRYLGMQRLEQQPHRGGACAIWNNEQHALAAALALGTAASHDFRNLRSIEFHGQKAHGSAASMA